jgi:dolichol-phosphate mannosyltransferase
MGCVFLPESKRRYFTDFFQDRRLSWTTSRTTLIPVVSRLIAAPLLPLAGVASDIQSEIGAGVLIVVATYDERENIRPLLVEILGNAPACHVLVVDDNSPDGTGAEVSSMASSESRIELVERPAKLGLGSAYQAGFRRGIEGGYDHVLTMDADFSHQPRHLPEILRRAREPGVDIVIGSRYVPGGGVVGWPLYRRLLSLGANMFARLVLGLRPHDNTGAYRCYSRHVVEELVKGSVVSHGYSSLIELIWTSQRQGFTISEVPITFTDRQFGESKVSRAEILRGVTTVLRLRFRPPRSFP